MEDKLGARMRVLVVAVRGNVSDSSGLALVHDVITATGMTEAPGSTLLKYPVDGRGGIGYTLFQPITESFIAFDAWPDLGGGYLVVCSCLGFYLSDIQAVIKNHNLQEVECRLLGVAI